RVDPAAVEQSLLLEDADGAEALAHVERHARGVERKRGEHQLVIAELARELDQTREHQLADAAAAIRTLDVDREVGDVTVRRARVVRVEAAPATVTGAARPAWAVGGLFKMVSGCVAPAWAVGGLFEMGSGCVVSATITGWRGARDLSHCRRSSGVRSSVSSVASRSSMPWL